MTKERLRERLFDEFYYISKVRQVLGSSPSGTRADVMAHYRAVGWRAHISPSPYFDFGWYFSTHPGFADSGRDPLEHYLETECEISSPHPLFDTGWYRRNYVEAGAPDFEIPILHYIERGWRNDARPNPLLWTDWYKKTYKIQSDPFYHFVLSWQSQDLNPNPLFDTRHYCEQLDRAPDPDPLSHYIHVGCHAGLAPHVQFDPAYYAQAASPDGSPLEGNLLAHYFEHKTVSPCPLFDTEIYLEEAGDETIYDIPLVDYIERGWAAGTRPHGHFSPKYYLAYNDDVRRAGLDPLLHYLRSGWREERQPHPLFDPRYYLKSCPDLSGRPLVHYLTQGWRQGKFIRPSEPVRSSVVRLPSKVALDIGPLLDGRSEPAEAFDEATSSRSPTIGIFAHIFYPELFAELVPYLNNVPFPCTIFMTTCEPIGAGTIADIAHRELRHPFQIKLVENRGRDIAPFIVHSRDELRRVDLGLHIHTKKSLHYKSEFASWRTYLLEHTLGSPALVREIVSLLQNPGIGAVAPSVYGPLEPLVNWGGNFECARKLLEETGEQLRADQPLEFPVGSMFWFKTKALAKLLSLHLDIRHFEPESGQIDGTLAHAIERSFFYFIEAAGFSWVQLAKNRKNARSLAWFHSLRPAQVRVLNRIMIRADEADVVGRYYPECTSFVCTGSDTARPRINLLVPTADGSQAYAGVATALDIFHALRSRLGSAFDARIVFTDVSPSNQYAPPPGFAIQPAIAPDPEEIDIVTDAAQRYKFPFPARRNDIFLATAWWTARSAFAIDDWQRKFYGRSPGRVLYLIQDFESGFYSWSTKYALAEATYRRPEQTIPIFNTCLLRDFFVRSGYYEDGHTLDPAINREFAAQLHRGTEKKRNVLLYARPHAERNCLPFLDMLVARLVQAQPKLWDGWRFLAIGETFDPAVLRCSKRIEVLGRLTLAEYAQLASESALAVSLMVSPHPSYPPFEMAEAGVLVLANIYGGRDPAEAHENIRSFRSFDVDGAACVLEMMALEWMKDPAIGWGGKPRISWFFDGATNLGKLADDLAREVVGLCPA